MSTAIDETGAQDDGFREFLPATGENKPDYDEVDISSSAFWRLSADQREDSFRILRELRPVSWQRPVQDAVIPDPKDPGYWAVTRHAEICEVSRNSHLYISGQGVMLDNLPPLVLEMALSFEAMDGDRHAQFRRLVSTAFTPRQVARMDKRIRAIAKSCVDEIGRRPASDFVADLAVQVPLITFCDLMGVPEHLRSTVAEAIAEAMAWADPEILAGRDPVEVQVTSCLALHEVAAEMYEERLCNPGDDLFTALMQARVDGEALDSGQLGAMFVLMAIAACDSTKHTASFAALGLTLFPDQRAWLVADFDARIDRAVEELVRYGTVVMNLRRTAVAETELAGVRITPGDKVVMFYTSANRDALVFADPDRLDFSRDPNPHQGFGGGGVHFCFGSGLAKSMLRALFSELLTRYPDFRVSHPRYLGTNFMRGITHLELDVNPG